MSDYQYPPAYPAPQAYQPAPAVPVDANYVAYLEQRVRALEMKAAGALVSGGFFKKAFAVWGYAFVANFIIGTVVSIVMFVISLIFGAAALSIFQEALQQSGGSVPF